MNYDELVRQYDFSNRVVVVTGGAGVLGGEIACALLGCNANVVVIDPRSGPARTVFIAPEALERTLPGNRGRRPAKRTPSELAAKNIVADFGRIDCLVNAAGGNNPGRNDRKRQIVF